MTLDPTARQANIKDSLKKFFIDSLETGAGRALTFDKALSAPDIQGKAVDRWYSIHFGQMVPEDLTDIIVELYCCTRKDNEGFKLAQLRDTAMEYLSADHAVTGDSTKRIDFYQSSPTVAWTKIGGLVIVSIVESGELEAPEETKFKVLTIRLKTASKV